MFIFCLSLKLLSAATEEHESSDQAAKKSALSNVVSLVGRKEQKKQVTPNAIRNKHTIPTESNRNF